MLAEFIASLSGAVGSAGRRDPNARLIKAYQTAYARAVRTGDFIDAVLSEELKRASVPGAYEDRTSERIRDVYAAWDLHMPPRRFRRTVIRARRKITLRRRSE